MNEIQINNLYFSYKAGSPVLEDITLKVKKGQYVSIIGHNGSGKSTLAKLIIGLLEADKGEIIVEDMLLTDTNVYDIRDKVSIVFQNPDNQFIGSTVRDDMAFGLENKCVDPKEMDSIIDKYISYVGMEEYLDHEPTKLSGGQKQRVAIASSLAMEPEVIILDEATSMLDPKGKKEVNDLIHELHNKHNMTILSITHDIEEVILSDYVVILNKGRIAFQGSPEDIMNEVQTLYDLSLDIPFSFKLYLELVEQGFKINERNNVERMVDELCASNSKI